MADQERDAEQLKLKARLLRGMAARTPGAVDASEYDERVEDKRSLDAAADRMEAKARRREPRPE